MRISPACARYETRPYDDLMGTLAWVRELVSMIHLAKFTGAPASRAEELVAQIAAAIEGISAVTWQEAGPESNDAAQGPVLIPDAFPRGDCFMRLFQRIGDIIAANLNDLVDRFEDPEVMLKQAIREMETMIEGATAGAARAIAGERLLAERPVGPRAKSCALAGKGRTRPSCAVMTIWPAGRSPAHEHEAMAQALLEQQTSAEQTAQALRSQVAAMRAKQAEARRKLASLASRRQVAQTSRASARDSRWVLEPDQWLRAVRENASPDRAGRGRGRSPGRALRERRREPRGGNRVARASSPHRG